MWYLKEFNQQIQFSPNYLNLVFNAYAFQVFHSVRSKTSENKCCSLVFINVLLKIRKTQQRSNLKGTNSKSIVLNIEMFLKHFNTSEIITCIFFIQGGPGKSYNS